MKLLSDSGRPALWLCNPRKNRFCQKRRCVFDGRRRYNLKNGCYQTTDRRYAVLNGAGEPMRVPDGADDYVDLLRCIEAECYGPPGKA